MTPPNAIHPTLDRIHGPLRRELAPLVPRIDREGLYPESYMHHLGAAGGLGACIPEPFGGLGLGLAHQLQATTAVASQCGSTAFLVWCQTASAWYLRQTSNVTVRERYLPAVAGGTWMAGSGLSNAIKHLDGLEKIYLTARRVADGYRVDGLLPWVSNLGPGHLLLTVADVPGAGYVMFLVRCDAEGLSLRPCPAFSGMEGTATLNPHFRDVHIPAADVLASPAEFPAYMARIKPGFILLQVGMALGIAQAGIANIHKFNASHGAVNAFLDDSEDALKARWQQLNQQANTLCVAADAGQADVIDVLRLRADVAALALRTALADALHAGARGYLLRSPVQRRQREATFFAIFTPAMKHARKVVHEHEHESAQPRAAKSA